MYPPISLYPNGAFMICEDVSEFDPNVEEPEVNVALQTEREADYAHGDPVVKSLTKLRPFYDNFVSKLMHVSYSYESNDDAIAKLEWIVTNTSRMIDAIRFCAMKMKGLSSFVRGRYIYEPFDSHKGYFMLNAAKVRQQGVEEFNYSYNVFPAFVHQCSIDKIIRAFYSDLELLHKFMDAATLSAISFNRDVPLTRNFDGFIDMLHCIYEDPDRMQRLESTETPSIRFDWLIGVKDYDTINDDMSAYGPCRGTHCMFMSLMSTMLKHISSHCYELMCKASDGSLNPAVYEHTLESILHEIINLFSIGTLVVMSLATNIRASMAERAAVEQYTEQLLSVMKTV